MKTYCHHMKNIINIIIPNLSPLNARGACYKRAEARNFLYKATLFFWRMPEIAAARDDLDITHPNVSSEWHRGLE